MCFTLYKIHIVKNESAYFERTYKKNEFKITKLFSNTLSKLFVSILIMTTITLTLPLSLSAAIETDDQVKKLAEEYTQEEKRQKGIELLNLGDELLDKKDYDEALATYEQVFLMDPENRKASAKIDILKKQMTKEGRSEAGVVKAVYEEESKQRVRGYWSETREYLKNKKYGQARLALEKILLLDPVNQEAQDLYEKLKTEAGKAPATDEKRETF